MTDIEYHLQNNSARRHRRRSYTVFGLSLEPAKSVL